MMTASFCQCFGWVLLSLLLLKVMLQASVAEVDVFVNPTKIDVGLSPSFDVNCTFSIDVSSTMTEIVSLTVSRGNDTELASITTFSDHQANVISNEGITADGVINPGGQSYIHLHWDYPTDTQNGTYQCLARGLDPSGQNVEEVNTSVVNSDGQEMKNLEALVKQMHTIFSDLLNRVSSLALNSQYDPPSIFVLPPLRYKNSRYYVSKSEFLDYNESSVICKAYGGILAEMDDLDEYYAVQDYLSTFSDLTYVYIGGTDEAEDGKWVLPSTGLPLPVADWYDTKYILYSGDTFNCLSVTWFEDWRMLSGRCQADETYHNRRYMCEITDA